MFNEKKEIETPLDLNSGVRGGLQKALDAALLDTDKLLVCMEGANGEGVAITKDRVIILKAGASSGALAGHKASSYFIKDIVATEISSGKTFGRLEIAVPGTKKSDSTKGLYEAMKAESIVQFYPSSQYDKFVKAHRIIVELIIGLTQ